MKNLIIAALLILSIGGMAYVDLQIINRAPYPTLAQEQPQWGRAG